MKTMMFTFAGTAQRLLDNLQDREELFQSMITFLEARGSEYCTVHWLADREGPYQFFYDAPDHESGTVDSFFLPALFHQVAYEC